MDYIITGAANGIGRAIATKIIRSGDSALLVDIDKENLIYVGELCRSIGAEVTTSCSDVRSNEDMDREISRWCASLGESLNPLTVFAVAGIAETSEDNSYDLAHARNNIETNYFGVINTVYPAIPVMEQRSKGIIVVISSTSAYRSTRRSGEYSASKAALNLWAEGMRFKLYDRGISVHLIEPGFVRTRMTEGNTHFMPFMVSKELMASSIIKAINRRTNRKVLPRRALIYVIPNILLPSHLYTRLFRFLDKHMGKK